MDLKGLIFFIQGSNFYHNVSVVKIIYFNLNLFASRIIFEAYFVCSAVDKFRKQFAHLEENGGKIGPVIPLDRKHASLPR